MTRSRRADRRMLEPCDDDRRLWANETLGALLGLRSVDRRALQLVYGRGLTQAQIAAQLSLPEAEIRRCVARGLRELAARLTSVGGRS